MVTNSTNRRQQRCRRSFSGVVIQLSLAVMAILSLGCVIIGTRRAAEISNGALNMPANFQSKHKSPLSNVVVKDRSHPNKRLNGDERIKSDEAVALTKSLRPNNEHIMIHLSDGVGDGNFTASHFSKTPRIAFLEGDASAYSRGKTDGKNRVIKKSKEELKAQERLLHSEDVSLRDPLYEGECVPMQEWQTTSFPICNIFHELDFFTKTVTNKFEFFTSGGYNDIFWLKANDKPDDPELAMKILIYGTGYTDRNFDRVRRDGLILERLTKSPFVMNTYGFCGFDVLTPFSDEGTLSTVLRKWSEGKKKLSPMTRLQYAVNAALGLAAVHDIDGEGLPSVAHGDLKGHQYLFLDGEMKLGDFNRGRFLRRNSTDPKTACTYTIGSNDGAFRSPEEYEYLPQTSAIDVYALGSIFYEILTGNEVWHNQDTENAQKQIRQGRLPKIDEELMESNDPVVVSLREAIAMCYVFDPKERAKAADIASYLQKKLLGLSLKDQSGVQEESERRERDE